MKIKNVLSQLLDRFRKKEKAKRISPEIQAQAILELRRREREGVKS